MVQFNHPRLGLIRHPLVVMKGQFVTAVVMDTGQSQPETHRGAGSRGRGVSEVLGYGTAGKGDHTGTGHSHQVLLHPGPASGKPGGNQETEIDFLTPSSSRLGQVSLPFAPPGCAYLFRTLIPLYFLFLLAYLSY